jgi:DNA-directed RNA polymerase specialized sigma54-like protein
MSAHDAAILRMLVAMDARQARIELMLAQILPVRLNSADRDLLQMIAAMQGKGGFWAKELWATVQDLRAAAEASGEPIPDIAQAFDDLGLTSVKSLGRWLAAQDTSVVERSEKTRDGILWQVVTLAG